MKLLIFKITICLIVTVFSQNLFGQWDNIAPSLLGSNIYLGTIAYQDGCVWVGEKSLFVSLDTGRTWRRSFDNTISGGYIIDIQAYNKSTCVVSIAETS